MFGRTKKTTTPDLSPIIDKLVAEMVEYGPDAPEFQYAMSKYQALNALQSQKERKGPDANTLVNAAASLGGILILVGYERMHAVTTKALGLVIKTDHT